MQKNRNNTQCQHNVVRLRIFICFFNETKLLFRLFQISKNNCNFQTTNLYIFHKCLQHMCMQVSNQPHPTCKYSPLKWSYLQISNTHHCRSSKLTSSTLLYQPQNSQMLQILAIDYIVHQFVAYACQLNMTNSQFTAAATSTRYFMQQHPRLIMPSYIHVSHLNHMHTPNHVVRHLMFLEQQCSIPSASTAP